MTPDRIQQYLAEAEALRDRLQAELADWQKLCRRFADVQSMLHDGQQQLLASIQASNQVLESIHEAFEADGSEDDWWKTTGEPPEFE